jgi:hypothetical protein
MFRFATVVRALAIATLLAFASPALAQQQAPLVGIDPIRASLDQIETQARGSPGLRKLQDLAQSLAPLRNNLRDKLADLEPRLADLDARLKGLGPAPAKDAAPEDAAIAAERMRLAQQRAEIDAAIKQVQLLQTRAEQLSASLSGRRRTAYAESLFQRSPNVLDQYFWVGGSAALDEPSASPGLAGRALTRTRVARRAASWARARRAHDPPHRPRALRRKAGLVARVGARYGKALAALLVFAVRRWQRRSPSSSCWSCSTNSSLSRRNSRVPPPVSFSAPRWRRSRACRRPPPEPRPGSAACR